MASTRLLEALISRHVREATGRSKTARRPSAPTTAEALTYGVFLEENAFIAFELSALYTALLESVKIRALFAACAEIFLKASSRIGLTSAS
jgi:hypothetical protein